ncbi:MAG: SDR family oxidoreductase [Nocardioidaceae bacterium]|nr:SDR family oxidoreductase [Nocardioidaceae bacterium]
MNLEGSRVLVTGASRGIGSALTTEFAAAGASVVLVGRDVAELEAVAGRTGGVAWQADLADVEQVHALVARVEAATGPLDVLVNNAGVENAGDFVEQSAAAVEGTYQLNLLTPVALCRQVLPGMLSRGRGHIVNVSSLAAFSAFPGVAVYGSSKAGLTQFTAGLRADLRGRPVGTTIAELGPVATGMLARLMEYAPTSDSFARLYRLGLVADVQPEEVAQAVVAAVRTGRRHVRLPRRTAVAAQLASSPRRTTEWLLSGVSHQQAG